MKKRMSTQKHLKHSKLYDSAEQSTLPLAVFHHGGGGEPSVHQGITYDTGGADIKAGGFMAGMHRDKCGAAAVAGSFSEICYSNSFAVHETSPQLFTFATLTGHAIRAMGPNYSIIMDNGPAHRNNNTSRWQKAWCGLPSILPH
uniref:putative aminopeptidase W07G4.4 n=1 Tax=Semicossyphus pulcher TaxID=241346 RepID=UPI0037E8FA46